MDTGHHLSQLWSLAEERRRAADVTLWQIPSVSIAAQAFLLNAGLDNDASDRTRWMVGGLGFLAVLATALVVGFQGVRTTVLGRWVERELEGTLNERTLAGKLGPSGLNRAQKVLLRIPSPFWFWGLILLAFAIADGYVFVNGL
jgi:hypothetical protein